MTSIETALQAQLMKVLDTESVYKNFIPRTEDNQWLGLPAATYRQLDEERAEFGDIGGSSIREAKFLVEMFSTDGCEVEAWKDILLDAFQGPVSTAKGDSSDAPRPTQWVVDGPTIYWAMASSPSSDLDAAAYEHHLTLNFEQLTLTITYSRPRSC